MGERDIWLSAFEVNWSNKWCSLLFKLSDLSKWLLSSFESWFKLFSLADWLLTWLVELNFSINLASTLCSLKPSNSMNFWFLSLWNVADMNFHKSTCDESTFSALYVQYSNSLPCWRAISKYCDFSTNSWSVVTWFMLTRWFNTLFEAISCSLCWLSFGMWPNVTNLPPNLTISNNYQNVSTKNKKN